MATYYVATNGSDGASGLDSSHPFLTIAHAMAAVVAGDTVLLRRGDRWAEALTVPADNITVDAYGVPTFDSMGYGSNAPVLEQGQFATGWSAYAGGVTVVYASDSFTGANGTALQSHTPNTGGPWTVLYNPQSTQMQLVSATNTVRANLASNIWYQIGPTESVADYYVQGDVLFKTIVAGENGRICARSAAGPNGYQAYLDSAGAVKIGKFLAGVGSFIGSTGSIGVPVAGTHYTVKITVQGTTINAYVNNVLQATATDPDVSAPGQPGIWLSTAAGFSDTTNVQIGNLSAGPIDPGTPTNTYQAVWTSNQPWIVDHNSTYSFRGFTMNSLADQEWYWYNNVLYFRNDAGLPGNAEIVAALRNNGVIAASRAGLALRNIAVEHANQAAYFLNNCVNPVLDTCYAQRTSYWNGSVGQNGAIHIVGASAANSVVQNCMLRFIGADGVYHNNGAGAQMLYNTFHQIYELVSNGMEIDAGGQAGTYVIRGNVVTYPSGKAGYNSNSSKGGLISFMDNTLFEQNFVAYGPLFGISMPGNASITRDNVVYNCGGGYYYTNHLGVNGGGGGIRFATNGGVDRSGHQVYRNLCLDCPTGIWGTIDTAHSWTGLLIANNTIVNVNTPPATQTAAGANVATGYQVYFTGGNGFGGTFQNNLISNLQGTGASLFFSTVSGSWASDHNLWNPDGVGAFNWLGTAYNSLAAYTAASGKDTASISAVPAFVTPGYTPPATPPIRAIDALVAYRNAWRSPARHLGAPISGIRQRIDPDAGLEYTYGWPLLDTNYDYSSLS